MENKEDYSVLLFIDPLTQEIFDYVINTQENIEKYVYCIIDILTNDIENAGVLLISKESNVTDGGVDNPVYYEYSALTRYQFDVCSFTELSQEIYWVDE